MKKVIILGLISLAALSTGCKSLWSEHVSTHFEKRGTSLIWVVQNNTSNPIVINSVTSGVTYRQYEEAYDENDELIQGVGLTAPMAKGIYQTKLVIPTGKHHEFTVQHVKPLRPNQAGTAWIRLDSPGHDLSGSFELEKY